MNRGASVTGVSGGADAYASSSFARRGSQPTADPAAEGAADAILSTTPGYRQSLNRIAVVGHPSSGYGNVLALLERSGLTVARPSRRESLMPQEINATLMSAHNAPPVESVLDEEGFAPIESGPVWQGMALDLMLGNLNEPLWGWADSNAIYALNYWKDLDPQLTFVLVYDEPHHALMEATRIHGGSPSSLDFERLLDNWTAYNSALLRFHLRHRARSVLVHAQQARRAARTYLERLQPLVDAPLCLPDDGDIDVSSDTPLLPAFLNWVIVATGAEPLQAAALLRGGAAQRYLVDHLLANHCRALQLHAELQSIASLPLDRDATVETNVAVAWESLTNERSFVTNLLAEIHAKYESAREELSQVRAGLENDRTEATREREQLVAQVQALQQSLSVEQTKGLQQQKELEKTSVEHRKKLHDLGAENELLLTQLNDVQEELERLYLRNRELGERDTKNAARYKASAERSRQRILSLIRRLKNAEKRFKSDTAREAQRVKQDISYRLGQVVLRHCRTPWGWLILPVALIQVVSEYRKERQGASR